MGALELEKQEEKGEFWYANLGFPHKDKYRPIYEKYFEKRKTMKLMPGN